MLNPLTHRKVLRKGVPGRAMIVERGTLDRGGTSFNLPMTLQVHVEGRTPYEVEDQWMVKAKDTVALDGWIPVRVDPDEPDRVAIDWDGVRANYEQEKAARREALASGQPAGIDAGALAQAEQALSAMGITVNLSDAVVTSWEGTPQPDADDTISKLERLAALHASGALTDAEFADQKRRILDPG
jgi:Short C-terminal domain